ncbi:hypothetical protein ACGFJC_00380 [Nonomuraea fuscirosea]|uniref:hypothetical protein n=1 Tax=Nonomuraea fuscirosea TaxID=1291556 RepID=UPI00342451B4
MGAVHDVPWDRPGVTDPITCPECEGGRGERIGPLFLTCRFCAGQGVVGGDNEPAERGAKPPPPPPPVARHRVWADPYVAAALGCRLCMGARTVLHIDEEAGTLIAVPCSCAGAPPSTPGGL